MSRQEEEQDVREVVVLFMLTTVLHFRGLRRRAPGKTVNRSPGMGEEKVYVGAMANHSVRTNELTMVVGFRTTAEAG